MTSVPQRSPVCLAVGAARSWKVVAVGSVSVALGERVGDWLPVPLALALWLTLGLT